MNCRIILILVVAGLFISLKSFARHPCDNPNYADRNSGRCDNWPKDKINLPRLSPPSSKKKLLTPKLSVEFSKKDKIKIKIAGKGEKIVSRVKYNLYIENYKKFPDSLFVASPRLPPCGKNRRSSRTWVEIYTTGWVKLYGFCGLTSTRNLKKLWVTILDPKPLNDSIFIVLKDRKTGNKYVSNSVLIDPINSK